MRMTAPVMAPPGLLSLQHPVWMCAMRPFFLLTMGSAVLLMPKKTGNAAIPRMRVAFSR